MSKSKKYTSKRKISRKTRHTSKRTRTRKLKGGNPDLVKKQYGKFIGFTIEVAHPKDAVIVNDGGQIRLTPEQIEKLGSDTKRYCKMLKDHLDYVSSVKRFSGGTGKNVVVVKL